MVTNSGVGSVVYYNCRYSGGGGCVDVHSLFHSGWVIPTLPRPLPTTVFFAATASIQMARDGHAPLCGRIW